MNSNNKTIVFPAKNTVISKESISKEVLNTYEKILCDLELTLKDMEIVAKYYYAMNQYIALGRTNGSVLAREAIENYIGDVKYIEDINMRHSFYNKYLELFVIANEIAEDENRKLS